MKRLLAILMALVLLPFVSASGIGTGIGGSIDVEDMVPIVWQCGDRILKDGEVQPWRVSDSGEELVERTQHYLFEGEKYQVDVVVFDKNKIDDVVVDLILGDVVGDADININCEKAWHEVDFHYCNARIDEEEIESFDPDTMAKYVCTLTVLDMEHHYGEYWLAVQADDGNEVGIYDEVAYWFLNPVIELSFDPAMTLEFGDEIRPGTASYSTIRIINEAEGGVVLDMFIAGKDWPAAEADMGRCYDPLTYELENYLSLGAFSYYAENGAYDTRDDEGHDHGYSTVVRDNTDPEGYININYLINDGFEEAMFDDAEIIQDGPLYEDGDHNTAGYAGNFLTAGGVGMSITFRLMLPEPCYGSFEAAGPDHESIFFYGEAV